VLPVSPVASIRHVLHFLREYCTNSLLYAIRLVTLVTAEFQARMLNILSNKRHIIFIAVTSATGNTPVTAVQNW